MATSIGHVDFIGRWEYYLMDGELYRAPIDAPVTTDGRRCGHWEAPELHVAVAIALARKNIRDPQIYTRNVD